MERQSFWLNTWKTLILKIITLFSRIQVFDSEQNKTRGIRLEDVKYAPNSLMPEVADWMGISDHPSLYESSFCGLQYWGPSSQVTSKITGFDTTSIDQPLGRFLDSKEIMIFETLFWPFSNLFGYTDLDEKEFRLQLKRIQPWLREPLAFEKSIFSHLSNDGRSIKCFVPYKRLHGFLNTLWTILDKEGTYQNMILPLDLDY